MGSRKRCRSCQCTNENISCLPKPVLGPQKVNVLQLPQILFTFKVNFIGYTTTHLFQNNIFSRSWS